AVWTSEWACVALSCSMSSGRARRERGHRQRTVRQVIYSSNWAGLLKGDGNPGRRCGVVMAAYNYTWRRKASCPAMMAGLVNTLWKSCSTKRCRESVMNLRDVAITLLCVLGVSLIGVAHFARWWINERTLFAALGVGSLLILPSCLMVTKQRAARWVLAT